MRLAPLLVAGLAVLGVGALFPRATWAADQVTLTSGLIIEGDIAVESDELIKIRVNGRMMQFARSAIANIEYGPESTAPSQIEKREEESQEDLEEAQEKVKEIKIRQRKKKKKKEEDEDKPERGSAATSSVVAADGTLIIPAQPSPEEEKWIEELRTGKNKIAACRSLATLKSTYALPNLIRALDDDGPIVRREANTALEKITQQDFGFVPDERKRSVRLEAIKRWQQWYEQASGRKVSW